MAGYTSLQSYGFSDTTSVAEALRQGLLKIALIGSQEYYECVVCNRSMAGIVPAEEHLKGSPHFKALRKACYTAPLEEAVSRLGVSEPKVSSHNSNLDRQSRSFTIGESNSDDKLVSAAMKRGIVTMSNAGGALSLTCTLCNITCTGEVPMSQHLDGEPHKKRQRRMQVLDSSEVGSSSVVHEEITTDSSVRQSVSPLRSDEGSWKKFQSPFNSDDIVKKAAEDGIISCETSGGIETWICLVCSKGCTGNVPMKQHLESSAHMKKFRMKMTYVTPQPTAGMQTTSSDRRSMSSVESIVSSSKGSTTSAETNEFSDRRSMSSVETTVYSYGRSSSVERESVPVSQTPIMPQTVSCQASTTFQIQKDPVEEAQCKGVVIDMDGSLMCLVCQSICTGRFNMEEHLSGDQHRKMLRDQIEQLQVFGRSDSSAYSNTTAPVPLPRKSLVTPQRSASRASSSTSSRSSPASWESDSPCSPLSHDNHNPVGPTSSTQTIRSSPDKTGSTQSTSGRGQSLLLPQNLQDIKVFFPGDSLRDL